MKDLRVPVYWLDKLVGHIINPKPDNFTIYGEWQPSKEKIYHDFLDILEKEGEVNVVVGNNDETVHGCIEVPPEEDIDIKILPR